VRGLFLGLGGVERVRGVLELRRRMKDDSTILYASASEKENAREWKKRETEEKAQKRPSSPRSWRS